MKVYAISDNFFDSIYGNEYISKKEMEELIEIALKNKHFKVNQVIYLRTAEEEMYDENKNDYASYLTELMSENVSDSFDSDFYEDYMDLDKEHEKILNDRLIKTIKQFQKDFNCGPWFYFLEERKQIQIKILNEKGKFKEITNR